MDNSNLTEVLERIAANVRKARLRRGMTQEALAETADVDLRTLQRVERATMNMRVGILVKIANALQLTAGNLFRAAKLPPPKRGRPPTKKGKSKKRKRSSARPN